MEITQEKTSDKNEDAVGSLNAFIKKAKSDTRQGKFDKYFDGIISFWFYQYTEAFHCKPDTINDMMYGLKYLYFNKAE